jgi:hypothetical protein
MHELKLKVAGEFHCPWRVLKALPEVLWHLQMVFGTRRRLQSCYEDPARTSETRRSRAPLCAQVLVARTLPGTFRSFRTNMPELHRRIRVSSDTRLKRFRVLIWNLYVHFRIRLRVAGLSRAVVSRDNIRSVP